jgi:hypothetical protein
MVGVSSWENNVSVVGVWQLFSGIVIVTLAPTLGGVRVPVDGLNLMFCTPLLAVLQFRLKPCGELL